MPAITVHVARSFDDPAVGPLTWDRLLSEGDTDTGTLTWEAQRQWWLFNERPGGLMLTLVRLDDRPVLIAPLFAESGMAMNLCPVSALDLVGDGGDPAVLDALIEAVRCRIDGFVGLRFHFVPHTSRTGQRLQQAAARLQLRCFLEDEQESPIIDLRGKPDAALACTRKQTTLRREKELARTGHVAVHHFRDAGDVLPQLDAFFQQHVARWSDTPTPSQFRSEKQRESFRARTGQLAQLGWLRFSRLDLDDRPIAFHRGTCYRGHYKYGRSTYAPDLAGFSPGAVLLRHVLLSAIEEGAHTFDFGLGDESYKFRYATDVIRLQTWGLYPNVANVGNVERRMSDAEKPHPLAGRAVHECFREQKDP